MADQYPSFSLGFSLDPDIFFDLENENENELLASVNLESPVGNSTNCTAIEGEISVQVTDQNTEPESNNKTINSTPKLEQKTVNFTQGHRFLDFATLSRDT